MLVTRVIIVAARTNGLAPVEASLAISSSSSAIAAGTDAAGRKRLPATTTSPDRYAPAGKAVLFEASTTARCTFGVEWRRVRWGRGRRRVVNERETAKVGRFLVGERERRGGREGYLEDEVGRDRRARCAVLKQRLPAGVQACGFAGLGRGHLGPRG